MRRKTKRESPDLDPEKELRSIINDISSDFLRFLAITKTDGTQNFASSLASNSKLKFVHDISKDVRQLTLNYTIASSLESSGFEHVVATLMYSRTIGDKVNIIVYTSNGWRVLNQLALVNDLMDVLENLSGEFLGDYRMDINKPKIRLI